MLTNVALRNVLKPSSGVLRELCSSASVKPWTCSSALLSGPRVSCVAGSFAVPPPVRHYARAIKQKPVFQSQLSDLTPTMLKNDFTDVPLAQTTDDVVKRLLSLELASHADKLKLKREQLIAKVQRDESDRSSVEVRVAILTARIRNYQEHLDKHRKDKINKRRMLIAIDKRKKLLKQFRMVRFDDFEKLCELLGISYTLPPEYYRRISHRALAKRTLCMKVFNEVQRRKKALQRWKMRQELALQEAANKKAKRKSDTTKST